MGRPWREEYYGGIYHVIARGNNREFVFKENDDKLYFLKILKENRAGMCYKLYGYVLMSNHYHLVLQVFDKKLQEIMHHINNKYSKYFNYRFQRVGHVFQGRYKGILVQDERYLLSLIRYIHQNPVKAGMCDSTDAYEWSSDNCYRTNDNSFVVIDTILSMLSNERGEAIKKYIEYMKQEEENDYDKVKAIGEEAYQIMCSSRKEVVQRKRLDEILIKYAANNEIYQLIKSGKKRKDLTEYKIRYIQEAIELNYTHKEIAKNIGITESAIRKLITISNKC